MMPRIRLLLCRRMACLMRHNGATISPGACQPAITREETKLGPHRLSLRRFVALELQGSLAHTLPDLHHMSAIHCSAFEVVPCENYQKSGAHILCLATTIDSVPAFSMSSAYEAIPCESYHKSDACILYLTPCLS